jgi:hypothetical protein
MAEKQTTFSTKVSALTHKRIKELSLAANQSQGDYITHLIDEYPKFQEIAKRLSNDLDAQKNFCDTYRTDSEKFQKLAISESAKVSVLIAEVNDLKAAIHSYLIGLMREEKPDYTCDEATAVEQFIKVSKTYGTYE